MSCEDGNQVPSRSTIVLAESKRAGRAPLVAPETVSGLCLAPCGPDSECECADRH